MTLVTVSAAHAAATTAATPLLRPAQRRHAAAFVIRTERASDVSARERLLDVCFGADRNLRTCQRLRDGRTPAKGLALVATRMGRVIGTVRLWHVNAGGADALMLGPLAVDPACRDLGIGAALMNHAISEARRLGHRAVVLLGDAPYYERFGFDAGLAAELALPGTYAQERLLGLELVPGALAFARGMIAKADAPAQKRATSPRVSMRKAA